MFIKISKEVDVNVSEIIAVEALNATSCQVHTAAKTFKSDMSKEVLITLIKKERSAGSIMEKMLQSIASGQTTPTP